VTNLVAHRLDQLTHHDARTELHQDGVDCQPPVMSAAVPAQLAASVQVKGASDAAGDVVGAVV
jgi:hypothetical protein